MADWRKWTLLLFDDILSRSLLFFLVTLNVNFVWSPDILFDLGNFDPLSGEYMQSGVVCGGSWGIQKNLFPSLSFSRWFPHCEVSFFLETFLHFELGGIQKNFSLTYFFLANINSYIVNLLMLLLFLRFMMRTVLTAFWWRFWRWRLFKILRLRFGQDFETEVQLRFWSWSVVKILKVKFGQDLVATDWSTFWARLLVDIWKLKFGDDSEAEFWPTYYIKSIYSVVPWEMFGYISTLSKNQFLLVRPWNKLEDMFDKKDEIRSRKWN